MATKWKNYMSPFTKLMATKLDWVLTLGRRLITQRHWLLVLLALKCHQLLFVFGWSCHQLLVVFAWKVMCLESAISFLVYLHWRYEWKLHIESCQQLYSNLRQKIIYQYWIDKFFLISCLLYRIIFEIIYLMIKLPH